MSSSSHNIKSDQHQQSSHTMKVNKLRKSTLFFGSILLLLLLANSANAEERPKTIQQLRSQARSSEQYRPRVFAESSVMISKEIPVHAPVAVTEVYGNSKTQLIAPNNVTVAEHPEVQQRSTPDTMGNMWASRIKRLIQSQGFQKIVMHNFINPKTKAWLPTGNDLWDSIISDCMRNPSLSCMQKNMYSYLDRTLVASDLNVTDNFLFIRNQVNYTDQLIRSNEIDDQDGQFQSTTPNDDLESRSFDGDNKNEDDTIQAGKLAESITEKPVRSQSDIISHLLDLGFLIGR